MDNFIAEVQITFIIMMGLTTIYLMFIHPILFKEVKLYQKARMILGVGTFVVVLHYIAQYTIQKQQYEDLINLRTIFNLTFGIPIAYFFNMSYIFLFWKTKVGQAVWLYAPLLFILVILTHFIPISQGIKILLLWCMYTSTIAYYAIMMFFYAHREVKEGWQQNICPSKRPVAKLTRQCMLISVLTTFLFPIMTFSTNEFYRGLCGLFALSVCFFYLMGFIFLGTEQLICNDEEKTLHTAPTENPSTEGVKRTELQMSTERRDRMEKAIKEFIHKEQYMKAGITLKEAANLMNVSCNMLQIWLKSTEYQKFTNWINMLRIEKSKRLMLSNPDMTTEELAERCGFCDRQYFSRLFSKQEGITPAKWIKDHTA